MNGCFKYLIINYPISCAPNPEPNVPYSPGVFIKPFRRKQPIEGPRVSLKARMATGQAPRYFSIRILILKNIPSVLRPVAQRCTAPSKGAWKHGRRTLSLPGRIVERRFEVSIDQFLFGIIRAAVKCVINNAIEMKIERATHNFLKPRQASRFEKRASPVDLWAHK